MTSAYRHQVHTAAAPGRRSTGKGTGAATKRRVCSKRKKTSAGSLYSAARRLALFACAVVVLLFVASGPLSSVFTRDAAAVQADQNLSEVQYKVIEIHKGDSLWSIARDNMGPGFSDIYEYMGEIRSCNQLETDYITSGNYLMIPYYETGGTNLASAN